MEDKFLRSLFIDWSKIDENSYLQKISAIRNLQQLSFHQNVTLFAGENGTGKSTLLVAIAEKYGFNREGGTKNYCFSTYDESAELVSGIRLVKGCALPQSGYFFRAESFFNVATKAVEYESCYGEKDLHKQSHGESFLSFFQSFTGKGLYLMDEPESALSYQRQLSLLIQIANMAKYGSQFIIATHSPVLLALPEAEILSFDGEIIHPCSYEDTESYQLLQLFVNHKDKFLAQLLYEE